MNSEQLIKVLVRKNECDKCLKKMIKKYPNMIDCIFRHNNDEHLCDKAKKYISKIKEDI